MKIFKKILVDVIVNLVVSLIGNKVAANKQQESSNEEATKSDK